jgi:uncharacterized protein (TIGR02271 family)
MSQKPPVHVELREGEWTVLREGNERATSVYPTQSEAAEVGRELARRAKTEFFLHARDGHVREHRSYEEESSLARSEDKGLVDQVTETAGTLAGGVAGVAATAVGSARKDAGQEQADRSTSSSDVGSDEGISEGEPNDATKEGRGLREARHEQKVEIPEERYAGYEIYSQDGERLGKLDALFVDENDNPEYVGVRIDPSGPTSFVLVPAEVITVEDAVRRMVVSCPKGLVEAAPSLGEGEQLGPGLEERARAHYGLKAPQAASHYGGYDAYYGSEAERAKERGPAEAAPIPSGVGNVGDRQPEGDSEELRLRRSEEELEAATREREVGAVRVRKRVRTDRERIVVPKKRVEVTIERVPVEGDAAGSEISEDEIVVPIVEEEVVVEKRPVVKEEIRIRKDVVEETEIVEEDVRREEIDVDDQDSTR